MNTHPRNPANPAAKETVRLARPAKKPATKETVRLDRPRPKTAPTAGASLEDYLKQQKPHVDPPPQ